MTEQDINDELADLEYLIDNVSKVYCHITGNRASKPMIYAEVINALHDDFVTETVDDYVQEEAEIINNELIHALQNRSINFPGVRTTFDKQLAEHVREETVKEICNYFKDKYGLPNDQYLR